MAGAFLVVVVLGGVLVVGALVAMFVAIARGGPEQYRRAVGWVGRLTTVLAVVLALVVVAQVVNTLVARVISVEVPIIGYWPQPPSGVQIQTAGHLVQGQMLHAQLELASLPMTTRLLLAGGTLLGGLGAVTVTLLVGRLCAGIVNGQPFTSALQRAGRISALVVLVSGLCGDLLLGIGQSRAGSDGLQVTGWSGGEQLDPSTISNAMPTPGFSIEMDFAPVFTALTIAVLVELVAMGIRLHQERSEMAADLEGLV